MKDKKPNLAQRATLETMTTTQPFELITIDYLYHDQCKEKYEYLLLVVDHFTKFAHTFSTKKQIGMIGTSFNNFLKNFRFPKQNLHDEGERNLTINCLRDYLKLSGLNLRKLPLTTRWETDCARE